VVRVHRPATPVFAVPFRSRNPKEETMNHEQAQTNLQLVLDWIDALRRGDIDAIANRFHPDVAWEDVAGGVACDGREQVLAWLRAAPDQPTDVDALELLADADHVVLGVRNHARQELAGVKVDGQLFTVFTLRDGQIVHRTTTPTAPTRSPRLDSATTSGGRH
jgi:ketosteroid isomerase-like protein